MHVSAPCLDTNITLLSDVLILIICTWFQEDDESLAQSSSSNQLEYLKGKNKKRAKTVINRNNRQEHPACIWEVSLTRYNFVFLSSSAVEFSFLSCFYLIERKQFFFFFFVDLVDYGTSWSLLLGNLILSQASMDQYVCFYLLLFSNFIPFFTFIRL